jgi:hypothetical protein
MEWRWSDHYARVHLENMGYIVKKAELTDDWGGLMKKKSKSKGGAAMFDYFQLERPNGKAPAAPKSVTLTDFWASVADYEAVPPLDPLALCVAQVPVYSEPSDATIPMPSDATIPAGWAVAEMKRLLTSRRLRERDAVQAACRRASAMKMAAGALASLASSSDGMPASLVKYVAELTTTDVPIDSGVISRCRTWLATNKHEMMKCKTPLAMIASAAPIVDATINNKAKALDPTLTDACQAALQLMKVAKAAERATAVAARKEAAAVAGARAKARAAAWAAGVAAEARAEAWAEGVFCEAPEPRKAAMARGRVRESRRRFRAAARGAGWVSTKEHLGRNRVAARCAPAAHVATCRGSLVRK